jgi:hypothetical protein
VPAQRFEHEQRRREQQRRARREPERQTHAGEQRLLRLEREQQVQGHEDGRDDVRRKPHGALQAAKEVHAAEAKQARQQQNFELAPP